MGVEGGAGDGLEEVGGADMEGTGAGDEDSAGLEHFKSTEIQFFVAAQGLVEIAFGFGEGRGVEDDGVVFFAGVGVVAEEVEGVGLDPLYFAII